MGRSPHLQEATAAVLVGAGERLLARVDAEVRVRGRVLQHRQTQTDSQEMLLVGICYVSQKYVRTVSLSIATDCVTGDSEVGDSEVIVR